MNETKAISRTAILIAVNMVFLTLAQLIWTNSLSFLALSSFTTGIAIVYINTRHSILLYISTTILAFILIPDKSIPIVYAVIFGNFGLIKFYAEKIKNNYTQFIVKTSYYIFVLYLSYVLIGDKLINLDQLLEKYDFPIYVFIIVFALLFNLFDFLYSIVINFILKRIGSKRK